MSFVNEMSKKDSFQSVISEEMPESKQQSIIYEESEEAEQEDQEIVLDAALIARIKSKLEGTIVVSDRYSTFFTGLKRNHPRNVAVVNPLFFMLRRIIFVISVIYFIDQPIFSVITFLCLTLAMLAYGIHERQWELASINRQNIFNETILYIVAVLFFAARGNFATVEINNHVGKAMMILIGSLIVVNSVFMVHSALKVAILYIKRVHNTRKAKQTQTRKKAITHEIKKLAAIFEFNKNTMS